MTYPWLIGFVFAFGRFLVIDADGDDDDDEASSVDDFVACLCDEPPGNEVELKCWTPDLRSLECDICRVYPYSAFVVHGRSFAHL